jgi:phenylalanyl-tRNA synthetase beta chain
MNVSYEWLKAFVPFDATPSQLRDLLTTHTAVVEDLIPLRSDLAPIVVARVTEAQRHPDSDHLWLTKVDFGGSAPIEVICGAPNVTAGKLYPFAPVGTTMPNGMKIERRKIRGITSNGMLCSSRELGLGDDHEGILELKLDEPPPLGTPLLSVMPVGDTRLVVDVGANRPDLLSHLGIAREVSAITGTAWQMPVIEGLPPQIPRPRAQDARGVTAGVEVRVEAGTRTRRYVGAVIRGVKIGPSPDWLVRRLEAVGVRAISNVVDATNYVLHELAQPVHAFDLAKLKGPIVVRLAKAGEKLTTLDGVAREMPANAVLIADDNGAQAVGGIMGGRESEVSADTRDLFIEVASFDPRLTRAGRKGLGLSTDASHRFERGVDPELAPVGMDRVIRLILLLAGGELAAAPLDIVGELPRQPDVKVRMSRVAQVLGAPVSASHARRYLESVGFESLSTSDHELNVRVPSWRGDVSAEIDLVEEIARLHGYDKFPDEIRPFRPTTTSDDPLWTMADRLRAALVGLGLYETRPIPFVSGSDETHVRVANPIADNEAFLRESLLETLARRAEFNLSHRTGDVRIFEIGSAFARGKSAMPREQLRLGVLIMGRRRPTHFTEPQPPAIDEWDAKGIGETAASVAFPGKPIALVPATGDSSVLWQIQVAGKTMGHVVRLSLDAPVWASPAFGLELVLGEMENQPAAPRGEHHYKEERVTAGSPAQKYRALPTMPAAEIDLALLVPRAITAAEVERVIRAASGELLERLELFDQYTGAGVADDHRSLAWRLTFRHADRTLRDKEIEGRRSKILDALQQELHVRQRST